MQHPLLDRFRTEIQRKRLADCCLILGPSAARNRALAEELARMLLEARGSLSDHPDATIFDPDELGVRGLQVAHIAEREGGGDSVESVLRYKPLQGGRRAIVLIGVDRMTADAQAALLKTAEEPPAGTHFVFTATDLAPILPALLSRSRIARASDPPAEELQRQAAASGIQEPQWQLLIAALGRGEAVLDLSRDQREALETAHQLFQAWLDDPTQPPDWIRLPDGTLAEQREQIQMELAACCGWLSRRYRDADHAQALRLDRLAQQLSEAMSRVRGQVTPSLVLEELFRWVRSPEAWQLGGLRNTIS